MVETELNQVIIQGWMINELKLKDSELLVYALIDNTTQFMKGYKYGIKLMRRLTGYSESHIYKTLKRLENKKLITKINKVYYSTRLITII